ncbi:MAG: DUF4013 domain-containing protein [Euryarchaeota archaeon]|nr:DUF4013 domain-containing protein [Euryarchaeota archaeon]
MTLSIGENLSDSFEFAKNGLVGHWSRWFILMVISCIPIVGFIQYGYLVKIFKGGDTAPELEVYEQMFINGIKLFIVVVAYLVLGLLIPFFLIFMPGFVLSNEMIKTLGDIFVVLGGVLGFMLSMVGGIRFAKTGSLSEAFNFGEILETLEKIGWLYYILSCIVFIIAFCVFVILLYAIVLFIPYIGGLPEELLSFILLALIFPFLILWGGKFFENLYSCA